jgi:hypothetical protein
MKQARPGLLGGGLGLRHLVIGLAQVPADIAELTEAGVIY